MSFRLGPAGLGPVKSAIATLDSYHLKGFRACEVAFTYGAYIKNETDARAIGSHAKKRDISLSIHAPYFVNLNSEDAKKREATKQRILECCKVGEWLGARTVVFHPGYYTSDRTATYERIREGVQELLHEIAKRAWTIQIAPETMGKVNVFGSIEEISRLVHDTGSSFCIDFAHILARDKIVDYARVAELFPQPNWHVHFSGIIYGDKGEKSHKTTEAGEWTTLLKHIPPEKSVTLVNESPTMIDDCIEGLKIAKKLKLVI